jgi:hypothetical protein
MLGADDDVAAGHMTRGNQRRERRGRGRVLDVAVPTHGKAEQLPHPVGNPQLELGRGRRGAPHERHLVQRRRDQLREDRRLRRGDREVGEEARALPVRERRQEQLVEVVQHVGKRLGLLARAHLREHRELADAL